MKETLDLSAYEQLSSVEAEGQHLENLVADMLKNACGQDQRCFLVAEQIRTGVYDISTPKQQIINAGKEREAAEPDFDATAYLDEQAQKLADQIIAAQFQQAA